MIVNIKDINIYTPKDKNSSTKKVRVATWLNEEKIA